MALGAHPRNLAWNSPRDPMSPEIPLSAVPENPSRAVLGFRNVLGVLVPSFRSRASKSCTAAHPLIRPRCPFGWRNARLFFSPFLLLPIPKFVETIIIKIQKREYHGKGSGRYYRSTIEELTTIRIQEYVCWICIR